MKSQRKVSARDRRASLPLIKLEGYEQHKYKISVIMGSFMLRHLNAVYQEFEGDMVQAIVLGEIGHHNITSYYSDDVPKMGMNEKIWDKPHPWKNLRPCNAFSISEATGIPRETVRRKIAILTRKGLLKLGPGGGMILTPAVRARFLGDFNVRFCRGLLETAERIRSLIGTQGRALDEKGSPAKS